MRRQSHAIGEIDREREPQRHRDTAGGETRRQGEWATRRSCMTWRERSRSIEIERMRRMARWKYQVLEYEAKGGILGKSRTMEDFLEDGKAYTRKHYLPELNALGREGWELVGVIPFTEDQGNLSKIHLILKKSE